MARWVPKLATLLEGQLENPTRGEPEIEMIQIWKKVLTLTPECANREAEHILKSVIKLMYNASHMDQSGESATIVKVK